MVIKDLKDFNGFNDPKDTNGFKVIAHRRHKKNCGASLRSPHTKIPTLLFGSLSNSYSNYFLGIQQSRIVIRR